MNSKTQKPEREQARILREIFSADRANYGPEFTWPQDQESGDILILGSVQMRHLDPQVRISAPGHPSQTVEADPVVLAAVAVQYLPHSEREEICKNWQELGIAGTHEQAARIIGGILESPVHLVGVLVKLVAQDRKQEALWMAGIIRELMQVDPVLLPERPPKRQGSWLGQSVI